METVIIPKSLVNIGPWSFKSTGLKKIFFEYDTTFPEVLPFSAFHWNEDGFYGHAFENLRATGYCNKQVANIPDVIQDNNGGSVVTMEKVDDVTTLGIGGVQADNTPVRQKGVYTLSGQRLSGAQNLPAGIYIVDGRKLVVK